MVNNAMPVYRRQRFFHGGCIARWIWVVFLALIIAPAANAYQIELSAGKVQYGNYTLTGLTGQLHEGGATLHVRSAVSASLPGLVLRELTLNCDSLGLGSDRICPAGPWSFAVADKAGKWQLPAGGTLEGLDRSNDAWVFNTSVASGKLTGKLSVRLGAVLTQADFEWKGQRIADLPVMAAIPQQVRWVRAGISSGRLILHWPEARPASLQYKITVRDLGFDSPEGRFAGENLGLQAAGTVQLDDALDTQVKGAISSGDLLIDNFYTSFSDLALQWGGRMSMHGKSLRLSELHLSDGRSVDIRAAAQMDLDKPLASLRYQVDHFEMHFPEAYDRYISSMAASWTLDGLSTTGSLLWSGKGKGSALASGVLDVQDLTIVDNKRGRFAVTGLAAHILPDNQRGESHFSWKGLLLRRINLGAGEVAVTAEPGQFSLAQPLQLNVLGGRLSLESLQVKLPGDNAGSDTEPEIRLYATLDNMNMEQLTKALGWPTFGGSISGKIPGVSIKGGVIGVDGQIEFNVFDGQILLSGLRIERPFGVLPSLSANLEVSNLDLQQLTQTFSFGNISGRLSGFVHDLRMLDWNPVAFDAWFGTPQQESGSHRISRQAVNRLTKIGGGNATAALSGPVMKLFSNFSYRRLGLGCRLQNNICEVRGLDDDPASVLIMEGAGVPKVMIRAYNRHMDWPTLLGGLSAASKGESIKIGEKP